MDADMATWNPRANDVFLQALEIRDHAARSAFVSQACGGEPELLDQVHALLVASEQPDNILERRGGRHGHRDVRGDR